MTNSTHDTKSTDVPGTQDQPDNAIDATASLELHLSTLDADADLPAVIATLNDVLICFRVFAEEMGVSRETVAAINERTKLMGKGHYKSGRSITKDKEPGFGTTPEEAEAVAYVKEYLGTWRRGQRYPVLSKLTDALAQANYVDRKGRRFDQRQVQQLATMGGFQGKFD